MSDFDKIIHDRLGEEQEFPGLEENWQNLATRLGPQTPPTWWSGVWRWLLPISMLLLLGLNAWFGSRLFDLQRENTVLRHEMEALKSQSPAFAATDTVVSTRVFLQKDTVWRTVYVMQNHRTLPAQTSQTPAMGTVFSMEKSGERLAAHTEQIAPNATAEAAAPIENPTAQAGSIMAKTSSPEPIAKTKAEAANRNASPENSTEKTIGETAQKANPTQETSQSAEQNVVENKVPSSAAPAGRADEIAAPETGRTTSRPVPIEPAASPDSTQTSAPLASENQPEKTENTAPNPTDFDASVGALPVKVRREPVIRLRDFAVGAHLTTGTTFVKGASPISGNGFSAEIGFAKNFRLSASADFLKYTYKGSPRQRDRLNLPEIPNTLPPGHRFESMQVTQKRQNIGISLQYLFPVRGHLQPYLSTGYAWQQLSQQEASFTARHPIAGTEIVLRQKLPKQQFGNNWTAGFGVARNWKHWGLDVSAEFQNSIGQKTLSVPLLRGGAKYRF